MLSQNTCQFLSRTLTRWAAPLLLLCTCAAPGRAQVSVLTQNNDNSRTGANLSETRLTPASVNVAGFGKIFTRTLDANVNGQVLYVPGVAIGGAVHNVIYAYTSNNANNSPCSLYAFDADDPNASAPLWHTTLTNSAQWTTCAPVIDPLTKTLFVLTKDVTDTGTNNLRAFDITTGLEKPGSPVAIAGSVPGVGVNSVGGRVAFQNSLANCRPGLLLINGTVYMAFAHNSDSAGYHGWVFGYHYDGTSFTQTAIFCATPNGGKTSGNGQGGGIWQAGKGLATDTADPPNIYCSVGNGTFTANTGGTDYGMCYLKLATPNLNVTSWFAPYDQLTQSNSDLDTGNSGLLGIPGTTRLFAGGTKFGSAFLLDAANLGGFSSARPDNAVLRLDGISGTNSIGQNPVCWDTGTVKYVYLWPKSATLKQFLYDPNAGTFSPAGIYKSISSTTGGPLAVTANGASNGILWAMGYNGIFHAYDATDLTRTELWNSSLNTTRDALGSIGHFEFPTVVNGKAYVPTNTATIVAYGLLTRTVSGTVALQGPASMAQGLVFTLTPTVANGIAPFTQTLTPSATGAFTLTGIPPGTYTLGIKGSKWLQSNAALDTTLANVTGMTPPSLLVGDINGDNQVAGADLAMVRAAYGSVPGMNNWNPLADVNGDGQVSAADLALVRSNYGKVGDP